MRSVLQSALRVVALPLILFLLAATPALAQEDHSALGREMSVIWVLPFGLLLAAIAVLPLFAAHWWEHNRNKAIVSVALSIPVLIYLLSHSGSHILGEKMWEFVQFIILLGSLFIIAGGVLIRGSFTGTPLVNTAVLAIGAGIASFVGTTGASMLLIRPVLRANAKRKHKAHVIIFFIFLVSNIGGCLTPLGDPPLFLGFLQGVPFEWTFRLVLQWLTCCAILLILFNLLDQYWFHREDVETEGDLDKEVESKSGVVIDGKANFAFLGGVLAAVIIGGKFHDSLPFGTQEALMLAMAVLSLKLTPKAIRTQNGFSWGPIVEVAILFIGIFITMIPALLLLNARGAELGVKEPWQYFWASGCLSSALDNAPTYLTFLELARGSGFPNEVAGVTHVILAAISCGAVFMGANTYIGNGPNFMVKAIAEEAGVKMPSFFGYMKWSGAILIPLFLLLTVIFFR